MTYVIFNPTVSMCSIKRSAVYILPLANGITYRCVGMCSSRFVCLSDCDTFNIHHTPHRSPISKTRGGYSHTWTWYRGSDVMTSVLRIFNPIESLFYTSTQSD